MDEHPILSRQLQCVTCEYVATNLKEKQQIGTQISNSGGNGDA